MNGQLEHWDNFKVRAFKQPYPDVRKVKRWLKTKQMPGRMIGDDPYIDSDAWFANNDKSITEQAMEILSA